MDLLELSKKTVALGLEKLTTLDKDNTKDFKFSSSVSREIKAKADLVIEELLIKELSKSGLSILSEEIGLIKSKKKSNFRFILDPIDGTVNFLRGINECSISVALFDDEKPIFGVLGSYPSCVISWGGKDIGAFFGGQPISVSSINDTNKGILCTGFPSRFDFNSNSIQEQASLMEGFNKVRMLGSASQSLLKLAQGSVEAYYEKSIMIWDIAAGIAIVEGAGGNYSISSIDDLNNPIEAIATNNLVIMPSKKI